MHTKNRFLSKVLLVTLLLNIITGAGTANALVSSNLSEIQQAEISRNLVTNGDFENGDFSGWSTSSLGASAIPEITSDTVYNGQYSAHISGQAADGMIIPVGVALAPGKRYIMSFAARLESTDTVTRNMSVFIYSQGGKDVALPYKSEEDPLTINGQTWQKMVLTVDTVDLTSNFKFYASPIMWISKPYYFDDYYVGELVIDDIDYLGETTVEIPKAGESAKSITIDTVLKNQLGTSNGLTEETVALELVGGAKAGVSLEGNILTVAENAMCQTVTIKASCTPSYTGAAQSYVSKNIDIELTNSEQLPEARGVEVIGTVEKDQVLTASYTYYSAQGVAENASVYQWYYCDTENGTYLPIEEESADTLNYTVSEARENSFIYFEVCPKDMNGVAGEPVKSRILRKPTAPIVNGNEIKILGTMALGETLTGSYVFFDANNDAEIKYPAENCTTYQWYRSNADGSYSPILGETGLTHTITSDDIDCYLKFEVTPRTAVEPKVGATATSGAALCAVRPTVNNLRIEKKSQNLYVASYQYAHAHGFAEGISQFKWYLNGSLIGTDSKVILDSNASGTLVLEFVPVASAEPSLGVMTSVSTNVTPTVNVVATNKGGGVSVGGSGSVGFVPVPTPTPTEAPAEPVTPVKHWASDAIDFVLSNGIMQNKSVNDFAMDELVTRAEFVSYIIRAIKQQGIPYENGFSDVSATDAFAEELQKAIEIGMISEAEQFYPERPIARDEICKILLFALGEENCSEEDATEAFLNLKDGNQIAEWAYGYVRKAMSIGLMNGVGNDEFMPRGNVTRAQTAVLAMRIANIILANGGVAE